MPGASLPASSAPPKAAAVALTTVMPVWTVAMNRSGDSRSSLTARAPGRRSSTSWASRLRRRAMTAISAPAKTPLARTSASTTSSSVTISLKKPSRPDPTGPAGLAVETPRKGPGRKIGLQLRRTSGAR